MPTASNAVPMRDSFLMPSKLAIDPALFVYGIPGIISKNSEPGGKQSSFVTIFSCWNTMLGTAIVSLPWAFQNSGFAVGMFITITSFLISFYTCKLILDTTGEDSDYADALRRYYGRKGWVAGLIVPMFLIFGGVTVYFVI